MLKTSGNKNAYKNLKVKAGALYYAVFISFIIALIIGSLLLYFHFQNHFVNSEILKNRMIDHMESGLNVVLANPETAPYNSNTSIDLFTDQSSSVQMKREHWGALDILKMKTTQKRFKKERIALLGKSIIILV